MTLPASPSVWTGLAGAYARVFAPVCAGTVDPLLDALLDVPGLCLLDVGAGTGTLAARARDRGARVTAVEPDPDMRALAAPLLGDAPLLAGALPALPCADAGFDRVAANFVVNHVPDPRAAVAELLRVTAPGGRVAVTVWPASSAQNELFTAVRETVGIAAEQARRLPAHLDFPRTTAGLAALLEEAGGVDVHAREVAWDHRTDPALLWSGAEDGVGAFGQLLRRQEPEVRARMRAAYDRLVVPLLDGEQLALPCRAVLAVATR